MEKRLLIVVGLLIVVLGVAIAANAPAQHDGSEPAGPKIILGESDGTITEWTVDPDIIGTTKVQPEKPKGTAKIKSENPRPDKTLKTERYKLRRDFMELHDSRLYCLQGKTEIEVSSLLFDVNVSGTRSKLEIDTSPNEIFWLFDEDPADPDSPRRILGKKNPVKDKIPKELGHIYAIHYMKGETPYPCTGFKIAGCPDLVCIDWPPSVK